jgi:DNA invertase Pin-like site-specific DNA recombinase
MNAQPVAYIRRSVARRGDPGDVSREFQTEKVRSLANGDGPRLRIVDADWGISADRESTSKRLAFLDLVAAVERGEVSTIYAFALDRLARSVQWSARLLDACEDAGTLVVTGEGRFDPTDDRDRQMFHFYAMQNEGALRGMKAKAKASVGTRRNRGDALGSRPYGEVRTRKDGVVVGRDEDPALIVATFREAGSYFAAAELLNRRKVPTRNGAQWYPRTVQRIVNRQDRTTVPLGHRRGVRSLGSRLFSGLLRCHCEAVMGQTVSGEGTPRYRCPLGVANQAHPRPYMINEARLLDAMKAEAAHLRVPFDQIQMAAGNEAERAVLEAKRERIIDQYIEDGNRAERDRRLDAIDKAVEALDVAQALVDVPQRVDWTITDTNTVSAVNAVLRALWERVELGPDLMPKPDGFVWRRAEWRA